MMFVPVLLTTVLLGSGEDIWELSTRIDDFSGQAASYAAAAHMPVLSDSQDGSEVRVWKFAAKSKTVRGWVLSQSEVRVYLGHGDIRLVATLHPQNADKLLHTFAQVADIEGSVCPVMRGTRLIIDGLQNRRHFSVYAGSPESCKTPMSQQIAAAYEQLSKLSTRAP